MTFNSFNSLRDYLASLPAPRPGTLRVFRGQTRNFRQMLPSGLRGRELRSESIFRVYTTMLASRIMADNGAPYGVSLDTFALWTRIIAQHYGPGSTFLDVSKALEVGLWFAFHELKVSVSQHLFGPPGPPNVETDTYAEAETVVCRRVESGYLFVFDVVPAQMTGPFSHGELLDMSSASEPFASSARLTSQAACLVYADRQLRDSDLSPFFTCDPIPVGQGFEDAPSVFSAMNTIFPDPEHDTWYDRFASIPWTPRLVSQGSLVTIQQPLPVSLYVDAHSNTATIAERLITTPPHNVHRCALEEIEWCSSPPHQLQRQLPLKDAVRIVLETPLLAPTPDVHSGAWNEGLLVQALPTITKVSRIGSSGPATVAMNNVFLELSPLEYTGWESVEKGRPMDVVRAIWLVRKDDLFVLSYFFQELPDNASITGAGGFVLTYDGSRNRFLRPDLRDPSDRSSDATTIMLKRLFATLFVLGCTAREPHAKPFPDFSASLPNGSARFVVSLFTSQNIRLVAARGFPDASLCYVPRVIETGKEFGSPVRPAGRLGLEVVSGRFADVDPSRLIAEAAKAVSKMD